MSSSDEAFMYCLAMVCGVCAIAAVLFYGLSAVVHFLINFFLAW